MCVAVWTQLPCVQQPYLQILFVCLKQVDMGTVALHLWPPQPMEGIPEPGPLPAAAHKVKPQRAPPGLHGRQLVDCRRRRDWREAPLLGEGEVDADDVRSKVSYGACFLWLGELLGICSAHNTEGGKWSNGCWCWAIKH